MIALPTALQEIMSKEQMRILQLAVFIPSGTELIFSISKVVFVGFTFSGKDVAGNPIPSYDFTTGKGIPWSAIYRQHLVLHKLNIRDHVMGTFYLTVDYLNRQIQYGSKDMHQGSQNDFEEHPRH